ncbi:hypothetical protein [Novosphingobium sp. Gsoil 351]|uniref:hypothetical protein n=1 Tax=Novosphingobium sp. Gsoil 351 TaxID=2675225 RepID=UPI0012B45B5C|nr:hypothetical protein [Novosphingobium sp. Gsoil 351]QGN54695.1 hypothetical protein GKE62_09175 [Novosphingobium sp. Gsoil 351]
MHKLLFASLVLSLTACATAADARKPHGLRPFADPGQVITTERAFARMAREKGTWTAFRHYATGDAQFPPPPAWSNVQQSLKGTPDPAQPILWGPDAAWSSCDGSFAVTTGEASFPSGRKSRFLTVWQRQESGEYRWVLDQGFDSAGGAIDPETISGKVAECLKGPRPSRDVRRGEAWGSAAANDGTLAWETAIAADCSRTAVVRMASDDGMKEVFRRTAPPPPVPAGQPAPHCA